PTPPPSRGSKPPVSVTENLGRPATCRTARSSPRSCFLYLSYSFTSRSLNFTPIGGATAGFFTVRVMIPRDSNRPGSTPIKCPLDGEAYCFVRLQMHNGTNL